MEVHGVGWVILVRLVPVQALRHPVGGQQISAGQSRHLWHLGLHASVKVLEKHVIMRLKKSNGQTWTIIFVSKSFMR